MGPFETFGISAIHLRDADGNEGEAPTTNQLAMLEAMLLPRLLREVPTAYSELYHDMYWAIRNTGFRGPAASTLGGVDLALHDLAARRAGKPLHRYLGATRDWAAVYGSGGGVNLTERELIDEMTGFVGRGFTSLKMKVGKNFGREMDEDVRRVKAVRKIVGPGPRLAVDANQTWAAEQALEFAKRIADQTIAWFEEPVHSADLSEIRTVCESSPIPVAMGESEMCGRVFPSLAEAGVTHLQPAVHQLSGVDEWLATRDLALSRGLAFSSGGFSQYVCQLIATAPETTETELLVPIIGTLDPLFKRKPQLRHGRYHLTDEPGISIRVDWDRLTKENQISIDKRWKRGDISASRPLVN
jgi:L-alanine-DL-glutamate epimerase-like enolase superfamily enzyme